MTTIFWLCRDFRVADNTALVAALKNGPIAPVFLIDKMLMEQGAASRWRLQRALAAFDADLRRRCGHGVLILRGEAEDELPKLARRISASAVHVTDWPCPQMRRVQDQARKALGDVPLLLHMGHLLIHPRMVHTKTGGAYKVYTPFARAVREAGPDQPIAAPRRIEIAPDLPQGEVLDNLNLAPDMRSGAAVLERHALDPGEAAALARLDDFLSHAKGYGEDRDRLDRPATSGLSEALAVGEISPRTIWAISMRRIQAGDTAADDARKFLSEVLWREFAWHLLIEFPQMDHRPWREEWSRFPWKSHGAGLDAWTQARTGIPAVDAGQREMRVTGRMHNRVRMITASYLTKHLMIDWKQGLRHFQDSLTDWDPASNAMNWQWVAGSGPDASPFFRIFNPVTQAQKFDPDATYLKRWLAGYRGSKSPDAKDYFDTLPRDWQVPSAYAAGDDAQELADRRQAALEAYAKMRD
ncbi:cryptochrome/photolyase family protein [Paracoccus laeviglucosivorans]|uniref:cryptochrome/photolyase family protein n=1 Tax=Paracoccus laeviglucosivorans TaxID=1197861 RepID=UPI00163D9AA9|nr:deoxyribodipyrimidine photo-lyase [Paracoccus laeviglucosivorans]